MLKGESPWAWGRKETKTFSLVKAFPSMIAAVITGIAQYLQNLKNSPLAVGPVAIAVGKVCLISLAAYTICYLCELLWKRYVGYPNFLLKEAEAALTEQRDRLVKAEARHAAALAEEQRRLAAELAEERARYEAELNKERELRKAEEARNGRAEIHGVAESFQAGSWNTEFFEGVPTTTFGFTFSLRLSNHRTTITNLVDVLLEGKSLKPPIHIQNVRLVRRFNSAVDMSLPLGVGKTFVMSATGTVTGIGEHSLGAIAMDALKVEVVDGFGNRHPIETVSGERLVFIR